MERETGGSGAEERGREAEALVAAAQRGDRRAWATLYARYRPRIYALALHLTGQPSDAEDVTQDAFLKAYARLQSFEGRSAFFTWLYRIALHRALNLQRDRGRRRTVGLDDARVAAAVEVEAYGDPQRALELQEKYARLLAAFDGLSETLRGTVVLTTLQGLSHREAAVVLGTTEGTVSWRVHEARRQLRLRMDARDPTPAEFALRARRVVHESDPARRIDLALAALMAAR